ncbi:MAG: hypothetical protein LBM76_01320 [Mycoplasmataceae bacterium]|nr:hypothetical protein [Mycoplasmataceae bacterium]
MRTPKWLIFLSSIVILLAFLFVLMFLGDVNVFNLHWLTPQYGTLWSGKVTDSTANYLWTTEPYSNILSSQYGSVAEFKDAYLNKFLKITNNTGAAFLNLNIVYVVIGIFAFSILLPIILLIFKKAGCDMFPFMIAVSVSMTTLIFTGLIPCNIGVQWIWLCRIAILIVVVAITFFSSNSLFNYFMVRSGNNVNIVNKISNDDQLMKKYDSKLTELVKKKKSDEITYVDIKK